MPPAALLTLIASLTFPLIATSSTPICIPSTAGYQFDTFTTIYQSFCGDLSGHGFTVSQEVYGVPVISLSFVPMRGTNKCDQTSCLSTFGTLIQSCSMNNHSVWGTGSLDAGCGTFNFTVGNTTSNPVGSAAKVIGAPATGTPKLLGLASASTSSGKPATTKLVVRSPTLGMSDSLIFPVSGASLLGVALIFCFL